MAGPEGARSYGLALYIAAPGIWVVEGRGSDFVDTVSGV